MTTMQNTQASSTTATLNRTERRTRTAVVESDLQDKTIKVRIDRSMKHPKYGKYLKRKSILHVHDEKNEAKVGDVVEIVECRPISKLKSWRLARVVRAAAQEGKRA
jgi:small subunit ribosomal protein S17